jgi:hypothetical protein
MDFPSPASVHGFVPSTFIPGAYHQSFSAEHVSWAEVPGTPPAEIGSLEEPLIALEGLMTRPAAVGWEPPRPARWQRPGIQYPRSKSVHGTRPLASSDARQRITHSGSARWRVRETYWDEPETARVLKVSTTPSQFPLFSTF